MATNYNNRNGVNKSRINSSVVFTGATDVNQTIQNIYDVANSASNTAVTSYDFANSVYGAANAAMETANSTLATAQSAILYANAAFSNATNVGLDLAHTAIYANGAYQ